MSIETDPGLLDYSTRPARLPLPVDPANDNLEISLDTRVLLQLVHPDPGVEGDVKVIVGGVDR